MQPRVRDVLVGALSVVALGLLAGCDAGSTAADSPLGQPSVTAPLEAATSEAASAEPSETAVPPTPVAPVSSTPAATPTPASPATTAPAPVAPASPSASKALRQVRADVAEITPQLESFYRDREYPEDLAQVRQTLSQSGVTLRPGDSVGAYTYDGDAVEFVLCVENTSGAWATYDTAPMTVGESGETGGCPS